MSSEVTVWSNAKPCFIVVQNPLCLVWAIEQLDTSCEGTSPRLSKPQQCAVSQCGYASDAHYASYLFSGYARVFMSQGAKVWPWLTLERDESYRNGKVIVHCLCAHTCVCVCTAYSCISGRNMKTDVFTKIHPTKWHPDPGDPSEVHQASACGTTLTCICISPSQPETSGLFSYLHVVTDGTDYLILSHLIFLMLVPIMPRIL